MGNAGPSESGGEGVGLLTSRDVRLGYCTNVHAGHDFDSTIANLRRYATMVRSQLRITGPLDIGLWLSAEAARDAKGRIDELRDTLGELSLRVFTINGFPYGDFHGPVVKHRVYEPSWCDPRRLDYTRDLATVMRGLLNEEEVGTISTVPVGWPGPPCRAVDLACAANHLRLAAGEMVEAMQETGREVRICLEPEPGCILNTSADVVSFWKEHVLTGNDIADIAYSWCLGICHDVCHSAVMFEEQREAFETYKAVGVNVYKVQVSSAVRGELTGSANDAAVMEALRSFVEPRYLHQTCVRADSAAAPGVSAAKRGSGNTPAPLDAGDVAREQRSDAVAGNAGDDRGRLAFYEDLPLALDAMAGHRLACEARVHFHVPIFMESIGVLGTTREQIGPALGLALAAGVEHFEVETYAWNVLPRGVAGEFDLAAGIADELRDTAGMLNERLRSGA